MQRSVRELDAFRTPVGRIRPRVTVGAETGVLTTLVLGHGTQDRRDVVSIGAVVDTAFALDSEAAPGQVRIGEHLAAALPRTWSRRLPGGSGRRLHLPAVPDAGHGAVRRSHADERTRQFLDPAVVAVIERGPSPAEHRTIGVAFVVIDGIRQHQLDAGRERTTEWLNDVIATVADACRDHDVCWLESDSERDRIRLMLTVGAPIRRENDTERLVDAARVISERHGVGVDVARGRAFVGDVGHDERRTYNVMGPTVNLAARLAGSATPGSILLTAGVAALVDRSFETDHAPALALKGFAEPVGVAILRRRRPVPVTPRTLSPLHGRDAELRTIVERIEGLQDERSAVEIVAGAGVGKSRLVEEIGSIAPVAVYRADGRRDRQTTPYAAVSPLLRRVLGIPIGLPPDAAGDLLLDRVRAEVPHLLPMTPLVATAAHVGVPDTDAADAVARTFRGTRTREVVIELLAAVREKPTVFIAEDVHVFDDASRLILAGLAAVERPWLVLATRRPDGASLDDFETITLAPLGERAIHDVIDDAIENAPMSRRELADIVEASAGNPLFAHELVLAAARGDVASVPDRIEGIIGSRIDHLDLDVRLMLRDLAVAGTEADSATVDLLLAEHGLGDDGLALAHDFLAVTAHGARFRHDLYRRAAYEGLSVKRRRELHGRLAADLAARPDASSRAAAIADHAHHAGDAPTTWLWARTAAAEALQQGATHEAAVHLERALATASLLAVGAPEEARVAEMLGDSLELAGRPADAHAAYRRARRAWASDRVEQARLCSKHARVDERAGRYRSSLRWTTQGLKLLDGLGRDEIATDLRLAAGVVRFFQGRFIEAIELAGAAADAADRTGATASLAQAHLQLEMAYSELGRKAERARHGARALELLEELDDRLSLANLHLNLGVSQYNEANWPQAIGHYERSAHYYRLVGDTIGAEAARNNQAEILTDQGRIDEAAVILDEVERALRAAQYPLGIAITTSGRARIALRRGDAISAGELLDAARTAFVDLDARHMVIDTDVRRVEHLVWAGRADEAERLADDVELELDEAGPVAILPATLARLRGWARLFVGDSTGARLRFHQAYASAGDEHFDYEVVLAIDALAAADGALIDGIDAGLQTAILGKLAVIAIPRPPWWPSRPDRAP